MAADQRAFRPDIEGLRGIAILLVVLFHAGVQALAGGFVGVDLFFVLSGFFITGLLLGDVERFGRVDLADFYGRRSLRLVPLLLVVLLATLGAVMWLYAPIDRAPIAATARAVALYSGNLEFARTSVDYFSSGDNPLLHSWSLAVEEQFYVVWPLLFVAIGFLHEQRGSASGNRATPRMLPWLIGLGIASFGTSLWLTQVAQPWAFFSMPTRIWEFALGAVVAVAAAEGREWTWTGNRWLQPAGLAAFGVAIATYDRATPYPGVAAVLPALGTVALLVGGRHAPGGLVTRLLSLAPLRWIGRMSYGWYLWHWPLVGLAVVLVPSLGVGGKLAWTAGALGLAWLTHRLVEEPARTGALSRIRMPVAGAACFVASVIVALVAHGAMRSAKHIAAQADQRGFAAARVDRMSRNCWVTTLDAVKGPCEVGDLGAATTVALLGDSHAEHWLGGLDRAGLERGWKIDAMVKGGCPVADMPELMYPRLQRFYHECSRYREAMIRRIIAMRPAAVILSSWDHYMPVNGDRSAWQVTPAIWRRGLRTTYQRLTAAGLVVIVLRDVPQVPFDVPACLARRAAGVPFSPPCEYERAASPSPLAVRAQADAMQGLPVHLIDMNDQLCAAERCAVVRGGVVVFTDDNQLTASFSRSVAPVLAARIAPFVTARPFRPRAPTALARP